MYRKRIYSILLICIATGGILFSILHTEAADIGKTRGRVIVDLDDFVCVEKTNDNSGLAPNGSHTEYELYFKNSFTDRNNIGATYRSNTAYEMTDVDAVEVYAYTQQTSQDKFLLYVNSDPKKYYHRMKLSDIHPGTVQGNGYVWAFRELVVRISNNVYSKTYRDIRTNIDPRYGKNYVFIGLAHEWQCHRASFHLNNETRGKDHGSTTLILKKHKITLLQPEYPKQVLEDGTKKDYIAFTNLRMCLEDGNSYDPGKAGDIYRDERVTVQYTLADAGNCKLKGYRFYRDKDRKDLLYTKWIEGGETECSFTFDAYLIQRMEDGKGRKSLGDVYIEPVFEQKSVTVDISPVVPEESNVEVSPVVSGAGGDYDTFSLRAKENGKTEEIGSFRKNKASHIGDVITFDYTPNPDYHGAYQFSHYEFRMCENKNQVSGTYPVEALYASDKYDISQKLEKTYFWMQLHVVLKAEITLSDKTETYHNRGVSIDPAEVSYPQGHPAPTGSISYNYYTDKECKEKDRLSELPIDAGTYYVTAALRQDAHYASAVSAPAVLTIEKAVPVLSGIRGSQITYGDPLSMSKITSGTAEGVSKSKIAGEYEWKDEDQVPHAGTCKADVIFTPTGKYADNYTTAEGKGVVSVAQAVPQIHMDPYEEVYCGDPISMRGAYAVGLYDEPTGQKISYEYYTSPGCERENKITAPVERGTYYVLASAAAQGDYGYVKTKADEAARLEIKPRPARLFQVLKGMEQGKPKEYCVYVPNAVADGPKGRIRVEWTGSSIEKTFYIDQIQKEEGTGMYYASVALGDEGISFKDHAVTMTASYEPVRDSDGKETDNYKIAGDMTEIDGTASGTVEEEVTLTYGGEPYTKSIKEILSENGILKDREIEKCGWFQGSRYDNDVTAFELLEEEAGNPQIKVIPRNAGTSAVVVDVVLTDQASVSTRCYVTVLCTVEKAEQTIYVQESDLTYNALPQTYSVMRKAVGEVESGDVTDFAEIHYTGTSCSGEEYDSGTTGVPPVDAGTYNMDIYIHSTGNLKEYNGTAAMVIKQAVPQIVLSDKSVTYDGRPHTVDPAVLESKIPGGTEVAGEVSYHYTGEDGTRIDSPDAPVHAGTYTVSAEVAAGGNYGAAVFDPSDPSAQVKLVVEQTKCTVKMIGKQAVYSGEPIWLDLPEMTGVGGEKVEAAVEIYYKPSVALGGNSGTGSGFIRNPTDAGIYYGWAVKENAGDYKAAVSDRVMLVICKAGIRVSVPDQTFTYTGKPVQIRGIAVQDQNGNDITAQTPVEYHFYRDSKATEEISAPVDAGTYYVQAWAAEQDNYLGSKSEVQKVTIEKAVPVLSDVKLTSIIYGDAGSQSQAEGKATGVEAENLDGCFVLEEKMQTVRPDAGDYTVNVRFIPDINAVGNYETAWAEATLTVLPYEPKITGDDKEGIYNGKPLALDEVILTGADGMPDPEGEIRYEYYMDENFVQPVQDSAAGVTDAGNYYCKVTFIPDAGNYKEVSKGYGVKVGKAPAAISLQAYLMDKGVSGNTVRIYGRLPGVFDLPSGTVSIYVRSSANGSQSAGSYQEAASNIAITKINGEYGFMKEIKDVPDGIYDFKAVYTEGNQKNYEVRDGELSEIHMNKNPQHIEFDQYLIQKTYGCGAFRLQVNEEEAPGSGEVTYRLMENISQPGVASISPDGMVEIKEVGTAFAEAVKEKDDDYNPAAAVVCIRIWKAPVTLTMEDQTVTYNGKGQGARAVAETPEGIVAEELPVTYLYANQERGYVLKEKPVEVGTYQTAAYIPETEHYLRAAGRSVLTIRPAQAAIKLAVSETDAGQNKVTLAGNLEGVFDWPAGSVDLYLSVHGKEKYILAAEGVTITEHEGVWGFSEGVKTPEKQIYDFKAVYVDDGESNYVIQDGIVEQIDMKNPPNTNPSNKPEGSDPDHTGNRKNSGGAADTKDAAPILSNLLLAGLSLTAMVWTKKRQRSYLWKKK